jgi:hypothetical protein
MGLSDWSRGRLLLIGSAIGALAAFSYTSSEVDNLPPGSVEQFLDRIGKTSSQQLSQGQPILQNVVVHPPVQGAYKNQVQVVKFDRLGIDRESGQPAVAQELVIVELPVGFGDKSFNTVEELLTSANQGFGTPWLRQPAIAYPAFIGAGAVGLALFVPAFFNVLSGGEYGRQRQLAKAKPKEGLGSYKPKPVEEKPVVKSGPSLEEQAELDRLNREMEQNLAGYSAGDSTGSSQAETSPQAPTAQAPMKLTGSAAEPEKPVESAEPEKPKSFSGQWYPVARETKKE